jgi:small subunit ribosomal protein S11
MKQIRPSLKGKVYIHSTSNNTIITVTDLKGNTISWSSSGSVGFKGSRRSTSYAAQLASIEAGTKARQKGISSIFVYVKGFGDGRESSIRGLKSSSLEIMSISDITPIPYNGCKSRKKRRL